MPIRTSSATVVFRRPFDLSGLNGTQPAGAYVVETSEELLDGVSFPAWRRHSTIIRLHPKPGLTLSATVDPRDLDAALLQDGAAAELRFESPARQAHRAGKRAFLDVMRSDRIARIAAEEPAAARHEECIAASPWRTSR